MGHNQICLLKCSLQLLWEEGMGTQSGCGDPVRRELHPSPGPGDTDVNLDWELGVMSEPRK